MANRIKSGTAIGDTVKQEVFTTWYSTIEVVNRGTVDLWARFDGVNPSVAGDECYYIAPQGYVQVRNPKLPPDTVQGTTSNCDVRLIADTSNCNYTITVGG